MQNRQVGQNQAPKLLEQVRNKIRLKHYSLRTEQVYLDWVKRYILFHGKRHPRDMSGVEVEQFLTHIAVKRNVSASTQNQAKSALLFLYRAVLVINLPLLDKVLAPHHQHQAKKWFSPESIVAG